jgi:hypothetical protein
VAEAADADPPEPVVVSLGDLLKAVQVTNGGGPKYTIPMGVVVLVLAVMVVVNTMQQWKTDQQVRHLVGLQASDAARISQVELFVIEQKRANAVAESAQRSDRELRREFIEAWRGFSSHVGEDE